MASVGDINIKVVANAKGVGPGLNDAERKLARFQSNANRIASNAGSGFLNLTNSIGGAALAASGLGSALSLGGAAAGLKGAIDRLDEIGDKAKGLGETASNLSQLDYIATRIGSSGDAATIGMDRLTKSIGDAATKGGDMQDTFSALGLNIDYLQTLSPAEAFISTVSAIGQLDSVYEKASVAQKLFGKGARELMAFFDDPTEITKFANDFNKFHGDINEAARVAGEAKDKFDDLSTSIKGLGENIVIALGPGVAKMVGATADAIGRITTGGLDGTASVAKAGMGGFADAFGGGVIDKLKQAIKLTVMPWLTNPKLLMGGASNLMDVLDNGQKAKYDNLSGFNISDLERKALGARVSSAATSQAEAQAAADSGKSFFEMSESAKRVAAARARAEAGGLVGAGGGVDAGVVGADYQPSLREVLDAQEKFAELSKAAEALIADVETPGEKLQKQLDEIATLYDARVINEEVSQRAIQKAYEDYERAIGAATRGITGDSGGAGGATTFTDSFGGGGMGGDMPGMSGGSSAFWDYNLPRGGFVGGSIPANYRVFDDPAAAAANGGRRSGYLRDFTASSFGGDDGMSENNRLLSEVARNSRNQGVYA